MNDQAKILVVDDEEIVLLSIKRILSKEGFQVETAQKANEGLEKARSGEFSLVITDLMMPEMNGIELMHAIKEAGVDVPFLMVTGYPTIKTAMQALRLGAVDYIPKPFTRVELTSPVNRALKRKPPKEGEQKQSSGKTKKGQLTPGDRFVLPEHSWAVYEQEGTIMIGAEGSFLESSGDIVEISVPSENEMIEQGHPTIKLKADDNSEHGVFSPFSGRVISVNQEVLDDPSRLDADTWIMRIIPSNLEEEVDSLVSE